MRAAWAWQSLTSFRSLLGFATAERCIQRPLTTFSQAGVVAKYPGLTYANSHSPCTPSDLELWAIEPLLSIPFVIHSWARTRHSVLHSLLCLVSAQPCWR
ncbi:hypothetical protein BKA60DRAFT_237224 [Fusarium oxysporum]|nr:hypothetical protein BKA60DRAFT_237224 [Fusarium oxysporum]